MDTGTPQGPVGGRGGGTLGFAASWALYALAALSLAVYPAAVAVRGWMIDAFEEFDTELPRLTTAMLSVPAAALLLAALAMLGAITFVQLAAGDRRLASSVHLLTITLSLIFAVAFALALMLPMLNLIKSVM